MHWLVPVALVFTGNLGWALIVTLLFICME
jgi:hypothetical protein